MLNVNSPTVQAMLNSTPIGYGNMPMYQGQSPNIQTVSDNNQPYQPILPQYGSYQTPYPSPKEMLTMNGENMVYRPNQFYQPNNPMVGGYNPGYQAAFYGYQNPYMNPYQGPQWMYPNSYNITEQMVYNYLPPEFQSMYISAKQMGRNFNDQVEIESKILIELSRIVAKNVGRSEEEQKKIEEGFKIKVTNLNDVIKEEQDRIHKPVMPMKVSICKGDTIIASSVVKDQNERDIIPPDSVITSYRKRNPKYIFDQMKEQSDNAKARYAAIVKNIYDNAPERKYDNVGLIEYINSGGMNESMVVAENIHFALAKMNRFNNIYDHDKFSNNLLINSGNDRVKANEDIIKRFISGHNGVKPDGSIIDPWRDPSLASSFSMDPLTGKINITAPNFVSSKIDSMRESFNRSI